MQRARRLLEWGYSSGEVAAETGVPVQTIGRWSRGETAAFGPRVSVQPWRPPHDGIYAYLLGLYLGDGHVQARSAGTCSLRVFLDGAYPDIVEDCVVAVGITTMGRSVNVQRVPGSGVRLVQCAWKRWPEVFPQHGPGRKHERPIVLEDWQDAIVAEHADEFIRGLIRSDGCRTVNRFKTKLPSGRVREYAYPRYFFSNLSPDIRRLFCEACERLGLRWTQSNPRNISVSHRDSVAVLEEFVGPKT